MAIEAMRKKLEKEYIKGTDVDFYIEGHQKPTWDRVSAGHCRYFKQQGRRQNLLRITNRFAIQQLRGEIEGVRKR